MNLLPVVLLIQSVAANNEIFQLGVETLFDATFTINVNHSSYSVRLLEEISRPLFKALKIAIKNEGTWDMNEVSPADILAESLEDYFKKVRNMAFNKPHGPNRSGQGLWIFFTKFTSSSDREPSITVRNSLCTGSKAVIMHHIKSDATDQDVEDVDSKKLLLRKILSTMNLEGCYCKDCIYDVSYGNSNNLTIPQCVIDDFTSEFWREICQPNIKLAGGGALCGNGLQEDGEECDCPDPSDQCFYCCENCRLTACAYVTPEVETVATQTVPIVTNPPETPETSTTKTAAAVVSTNRNANSTFVIATCAVAGIAVISLIVLTVLLIRRRKRRRHERRFAIDKNEALFRVKSIETIDSSIDPNPEPHPVSKKPDHHNRRPTPTRHVSPKPHGPRHQNPHHNHGKHGNKNNGKRK